MRVDLDQKQIQIHRGIAIADCTAAAFARGRRWWKRRSGNEAFAHVVALCRCAARSGIP
jgi:hypothetical protein